MFLAKVWSYLAGLFTSFLIVLHVINPTPAPSPMLDASSSAQVEASASGAVNPTVTPTPLLLKPSVVPKPTTKPTPQISINNTPPGAGYQRQTVQTDIGSFTVDIIAADLGSTRVIVDTASESTCTNNCPTVSLGDFIARNGAFAGINGSYFCPESYSQCAGKTNSFDTLLMNKNKVYFNSDNNMYSTVPAVIFGNGYIRFIQQSLEWGRDTGIDSMIANYPMLVFNNNVVGYSTEDGKLTSRGPRSFVANRGSMIYIGFVNTATVGEAAKVLGAMGMENALHLDDGGSTALWYGGYKKGPGRNLANAVLFVSK
ncbi:MAG: hypothetical protein A2700_01280 [Candidatus Blackburnbacteria bacterium RIFCSPHIGHO2_01_FULL_44_64]|uniref:Phosphodiester glycosidase domain-containing protein n=1 Tax=Candidatus Blackburnbacteria bacterium RIFCSPHIGHO2_02_FULL_44_20 TaxID=1797516 RepID=A0A1G1V6I3_9BACT|nr:MAG: hypothetical protein A2700_01280 [Candidatus Blackburnbacteria bacterium RIFCSPHIGHO2_01_FULL_44_64]OGY10716.1 MAG: hypothetical protein A3E16_01815 [Candidatus Blackburnbacteria bacterium RIFCSPHIGHO2_12_FULL_44_25]OGY11018.1 MAG: hypothetical protein A3D26_03825 [Candidatus Blackburnbacteria bacterium RIFCSPHIGHO2_02_FULL_44_20]OGY15212.1 MAG: hypothetical protein A3A62_02575 [Candidatus Blackburnbacteria bacterium RIFCSPLOWO2_01_FULL_44_43]